MVCIAEDQYLNWSLKNISHNPVKSTNESKTTNNSNRNPQNSTKNRKMKASYKQEPGALAMNITTLYRRVTCSKAPLCYGRELLIRTIPHLFPVGTHTHTHVTNTLFSNL